MDRLFLDANVLFSAAWAEESRFRLLWRLPQAEVLVSPYVVAEVRRNLTGAPAAVRLEGLLARSRLVADAADEEIPPGIALDPGDRPVLAAAIRAKATHLITGDRRDFGALFGLRIRGVRILRPADYLESRRRRRRAPGATTP